MAYTLYIERKPAGITLDERINAVKQLNGVRLDDADLLTTNPHTGESIIIRGHPGNVAVLFETKGFLGFGKKAEWCTCIGFLQNSASFKATEIKRVSNCFKKYLSSTKK